MALHSAHCCASLSSIPRSISDPILPSSEGLTCMVKLQEAVRLWLHPGGALPVCPPLLLAVQDLPAGHCWRWGRPPTCRHGSEGLEMMDVQQSARSCCLGRGCCDNPSGTGSGAKADLGYFVSVGFVRERLQGEAKLLRGAAPWCCTGCCAGVALGHGLVLLLQGRGRCGLHCCPPQVG